MHDRLRLTNGGHAGAASRFIDILAIRAEQHRDRPALLLADRDVSYGELWSLAMAEREWLATSGLPPGQRVLLEGGSVIDTCVTMVALWQHRCCPVPTSLCWPRERLREVAESAGVWLDESGPAHAASDGDNLACLLFSESGAARAEGLAITQERLARHAEMLSGLLHLTPDDRVLHMADLWVDMSICEIAATWWAGAALCLAPSAQAVRAPRFVRDQALTVWFSVPSTLHLCHRDGLLSAHSLPTLRLSVVAGGEALADSTASVLRQAAPQARLLSLGPDFAVQSAPLPSATSQATAFASTD